MISKIRNFPPVCLGISLLRLLFRYLRYSKEFIGEKVIVEDGQSFTIFRHITSHPVKESKKPCVFIVSFKFARLSHKANKMVSKIPMLIITGYPGFVTKIYAVNHENGCWQGMYQWESKEALEDYKQSFVFKMMNKRAIKNTIRSLEFENQKLSVFLNSHLEITTFN